MRVALVSPYSYTYPGGVGRHVEALASELSAQGHEVRLLAPYAPDDRLAIKERATRDLIAFASGGKKKGTGAAKPGRR